ncbi:hypothetical protein ABT373_40455 [Streptomyces sp. NPDC000070]|uniref:hypothetical protein n=1 Tax=Streptomyces sp. NPDC000070 TaxID=3154240 RepID=UPI0033180503
MGVEQLLRLSPWAVLLAVSFQGQETGYPVVQRFLSSADGGSLGDCYEPASVGASAVRS